MLSARDIKEVAHEVGFDLCGITPAVALDSARGRFEEWLAHARNGSLDYLERNVDKRFDASLLVDGAESVVVCGVAYKNEFSDGYGDSATPRVASYALYEDYHDTIRGMLRQMAQRLGLIERGVMWRGFSDSAPVAEKTLAVRAGLGAIGRNSLLITPEYGSFIMLGELIFAEGVDEYDKPFEEDLCGECHLCVSHCPARAIIGGRAIDASRCISRLTIEPIESQVENKWLHGWVFGCDECQSVCPYNKRVAVVNNCALIKIFSPTDYDASRWRSMTAEEFKTTFGKTPLVRAGLERLKQNLPDE